MEHPSPDTVLSKNDHIYLMGSDGQLEQAVRKFFEKKATGIKSLKLLESC